MLSIGNHSPSSNPAAVMLSFYKIHRSMNRLKMTMLSSKTEQQSLFISIFILLWSLLFGAFVRLYAPAQTDFPILDGGLFYVMIQDLLRENFRLPTSTSFNQANIPFAYPPIAFYFAGFLSQFLNIDLLDVIHWLPAVLASAAIPAFYLLSRSILGDNLLASLATLAYAMLPATFYLYITGGGLTRSWGMLFSLLTLFSAYELYTRRQMKKVFRTAIFASLLVTGHPETSFYTLAIVGLFWLFKGRDKHTALLSVFTAALILLFTSPWWLIVLRKHGLSPFLASLQSGWHHWLFWTPILKMDFAGERFLSIITVFGLIGFIAQVSHKSYLLPAWLLLPFAIEPRNPALFASLALCMLSAIGFQQIIQGMVNSVQKLSADPSSGIEVLSHPSSKLLFAFFLLYPLIGAFSTSLELSSYYLTREQREALKWVRGNTSEDSRFVIVAFEGTFANPFQEWLPSLTGRVNVAVEVGYEWMPNHAFEKRRKAFFALNRCVFETIDCVEAWADQQELQIDYVVVYQTLITPTDYKLGTEPIRSMTQSPNYQMVYQSNFIKIFRRTNP